MNDRWMIYGANGYTGERIAREAAKRGLRPVLAGRRGDKLAALGVELGLEHRVFALDDETAVARNLEGMSVVLLCAGPFSATSRVVRRAGMLAGCHYLDITGEIAVIEAAAAEDELARRAGVAIIPAVGFDVVPSDCLAAMLAGRLPGANRLTLAFHADGKLSPGTAKTAVEGMAQGVLTRVDGVISPHRGAPKRRKIPFSCGVKTATLIPWGDVASAHHSTGIPNIETYAVLSSGPLSALLPIARWLVRFDGVRASLVKWIEKNVPGPSETQLAASSAWLWGEVVDGAGRRVSATLDTPGGYPLTILTALACVERVLDNPPHAGFHTPSRAFGHDYILSMRDTRMTWLES